jgi:Conserved hypothetical protein (DUF2461)
VFRIHRDVRFSKNKSPYKTNAGAWLYHRDAGCKVGRVGESGGAGFYFHIDHHLLHGRRHVDARPARAPAHPRGDRGPAHRSGAAHEHRDSGGDSTA